MTTAKTAPTVCMARRAGACTEAGVSPRVSPSGTKIASQQRQGSNAPNAPPTVGLGSVFFSGASHLGHRLDDLFLPTTSNWSNAPSTVDGQLLYILVHHISGIVSTTKARHETKMSTRMKT